MAMLEGTVISQIRSVMATSRHPKAQRSRKALGRNRVRTLVGKISAFGRAPSAPSVGLRLALTDKTPLTRTTNDCYRLLG
jgi:hypothetical protein